MNWHGLLNFLFRGTPDEAPVLLDPVLSLPTFTLPPQDPAFSLYGPQEGYFGTLAKNSTGWYHCRELFHSAVDDNYLKLEYVYVLGDCQPESTIDLIGWVEDRLNLTTKTTFAIQRKYKCKLGDQIVLKVQPAEFWWDKLHHSFFTCVLRASTEVTNRDSPITTLKEYKYFANTWPFVEWFLNGNTKYIGLPALRYESQGWQQTFGKVTALPETLLQRP